MIPEFNIVLDQPNKVFFSGDDVTGHILLRTDTSLPLHCIMIKFIGEAKYRIPKEIISGRPVFKQIKSKKKNRRKILCNNKVCPAPTPTDPVQSKKKQLANNGQKQKCEVLVNSKTYFNKGIFLFGHKYSSYREYLPAGTHTLQFQYTLPASLPTTYYGRFSYIHYYCEAHLERWAVPSEKRRTYFNVSNIADINYEPKADMDCNITKTTNCWLLCCPRGTVVVSTRLQRLGVVPGQIVPLETDIHNMSNMHITETFVSIIQVTAHFNDHGALIYEDERTVADCNKGPVSRGEFLMWTEGLVVPPLPPTSFGPTACKLITLNYKLQVHVEFSRSNDPVIIRMPLIIGNIPFKKDFKNYETICDSDKNNQNQMPNIFKMMPDFPVVWSVECENMLQSECSYNLSKFTPRYPFYKLKYQQRRYPIPDSNNKITNENALTS
ncbi:arrestin domain-containing protein 17-like [Lycorma delicatula]|uniref:arrestin domain-containing protein 17-like n=1 Tax=Lycorma delicatula TaxID=130591 RepID=UPI003F5198DF